MTGDDGVPAKRPSNSWNIALFAACIGLIAYSIRGVLSRLASGVTLDFYHFYEGARAVWNGTDLYESGVGGYIYPPLFAFLLVPITGLSHDTANVVWVLLNVLLTIAILCLGFRVLQKGFLLQCTLWQAIGMCSLAVLLTSEQVRWELIMGQSDTVTLFGIALCLYWLERLPLAAGWALGAVANVKYQSVALLPYLLFRGRWRTVAGLLLGFVGCALLPAVVIGWDKNLEYLGIAFGGIASLVGIKAGRSAGVPDLLWQNNVTITSGLARICVDVGWPQRFAFPMVAVVAAVVGLMLWAMFRKFDIPFLWRGPRALGSEAQETGVVCLEWCALLVGLLVFSPMGTKRHLFLLLPVNLLVAMMFWFPRTRLRLLIAGVLIAQLGLRLPSREISETAAAAWHHVGGPDWCVMVSLLCTTWTGLAYWQVTHANPKQIA